MSFQNGMLNLTNWLGNVIMPTIAGLFAAAAIYRFSKAQPGQHFAWAGLASLMLFRFVAGSRIFQQPGGLEQPRSFLAGRLNAGELGGKCALATVRGAAGGAERGALLRIAGTDDDR